MSNWTKFFQRFSLEQKTVTGFGLALATLMAVGALQYRVTRALIETDRWVAHTNAVRAELEQAYSAIQQAEAGTRGFVATGNESFLQQHQVGISRAGEYLRTLPGLIAESPLQRHNVDRLLSLTDRKIAQMQDLVSLRRERGFVAASRELNKGEGLSLMNEIREVVDSMQLHEEKLLHVREAASRAVARNAETMIVLGALLALAFGIVAGWITHRDIAQRERAQVSRARLAAIVESSDDAIMGRTLDGIIQSWNAGAERLYGYSAEEAKGRPVSILLPPDRLDEEPSILKRIDKGESVDHFETVRARKDGRLVPVALTVSPLRDVTGKVVGMSSIARDITAQKQASQYARSLLEASLDPLVTISPDGKITDVNEATFKVTGVAREKLVGTDFSNYFTEPEKAREGYKQVFAKGMVTDYPLTVRHVDGRLTDVLYNASVYRDPRGNVLGVFAAARDITARKRAEIEIRKLNDELEQRVAKRTAALEASNKELEAFTYSVSHDLRAPLRHVDGFSKLLSEECEAQLSPEAQEYVSAIRESVQQMGVLIDDLLNLARTGRKELRVEVTGLNSLVQEVIADLRRANPTRDIQWKVQTLPFVECDPALMKQVFANLLSNAVKFTRPRRPAVIEIGVTSQDSRSTVFVRDNGVGFSMKYADKLFGVFQRLHRTEDFEGTGVGLATVQRIIHKHGGRIWGEAELDKGATFHFSLGTFEGKQLDSQPSGGGKQ